MDMQNVMVNNALDEIEQSPTDIPKTIAES
jgi:hypothetical protein